MNFSELTLSDAGALFGNDSFYREIVRFGGKLGEDLGGEGDADARNERDLGEEAVVIAGALSEAIASEVEGESWDQNEVKVFDGGGGMFGGNGFGDVEFAFL